MVGWRGGEVDTSSHWWSRRGDRCFKAELGAEAAVGLARWFEVSLLLWMSCSGEICMAIGNFVGIMESGRVGLLDD